MIQESKPLPHTHRIDGEAYLMELDDIPVQKQRQKTFAEQLSDRLDQSQALNEKLERTRQALESPSSSYATHQGIQLRPYNSLQQERTVNFADAGSPRNPINAVLKNSKTRKNFKRNGDIFDA